MDSSSSVEEANFKLLLNSKRNASLKTIRRTIYKIVNKVLNHLLKNNKFYMVISFKFLPEQNIKTQLRPRDWDSEHSPSMKLSNDPF